MLSILNLGEIREMLLRIPALVDGLERHHTNAVEQVRSWLTKLEDILTNNRMSDAGNVAALRGVLASAERGVIPPELHFGQRTTARKIAEATAVDILRRVSDFVSNAVREDVSRISEAERIARKLVAVARFKGLIPDKPFEGDVTEHLKATWRRMSTDPDIGPGSVGMLGLIGPNDALEILDRTIRADPPIRLASEPQP